MRRLGAGLALAALVLLGAALRLRLSKAVPSYDPARETGTFHAESAFQYRYAAMAARGEAIPELDRAAQWPEGVRTRRELTLWMEYATGWSYRLLPEGLRPDFRDFTLGWSALVSSLSIPALFALALALGASAAEALAAAALYGLSWGAFSNSIGTYQFESFALPLIHASLAALLWALRGGPRAGALGLLSGGLMGLALGSWHLTRFALAGLFLAAAAAARRAGEAERAQLGRALGRLLLGCAAAGALAGSLRESRFLLSPAMGLGAGLWLWLRLPRWRGLIVRAGLPLLAARVLVFPEAGPYGHAYDLLLEKLRWGLSKPADPALLSEDARLLWMGPFNSPEAGLALFTLLPMSLGLLPRLLTRPGAPPRAVPAAARLSDALLALHAAAALLVARLLPMLCFQLCLAAVNFPEARRRRARLAAALVLLAALEGLKSYAPASPLNPFMALSAAFSAPESRPAFEVKNEVALLDWLKAHAGPETPVLAGFSLSAPILAYAGAPVLLQPKFEAAGIRRKTADFLRALYSGEADLLAYARRHGAALLVYETEFLLDKTTDGPLYAAGLSKVKAESAAALLHFKPEDAKGFRLLYENPDYRVYAVGAGGKPLSGPRAPVYELARYSPRALPDGTLELDTAGVLAAIEASRSEVLKARVLSALGRPGSAVLAYERAFALWPPDPGLRAEAETLARSLDRGGS